MGEKKPAHPLLPPEDYHHLIREIVTNRVFLSKAKPELSILQLEVEMFQLKVPSSELKVPTFQL